MYALKGVNPTPASVGTIELGDVRSVGSPQAVKGMLGPLRSIMWTDHSNLTRLQTSEEIQPKHLRWLRLSPGALEREIKRIETRRVPERRKEATWPDLASRNALLELKVKMLQANLREYQAKEAEQRNRLNEEPWALKFGLKGSRTEAGGGQKVEFLPPPCRRSA